MVVNDSRVGAWRKSEGDRSVGLIRSEKIVRVITRLVGVRYVSKMRLRMVVDIVGSAEFRRWDDPVA